MIFGPVESGFFIDAILSKFSEIFFYKLIGRFPYSQNNFILRKNIKNESLHPSFNRLRYDQRELPVSPHQGHRVAGPMAVPLH